MSFDAKKFVGKWQLTESENFDGYMKQAGIGFITRTAAKAGKSSLEFTVLDDHWTMVSKYSLTTHTLEFDIGKEFEHKTVDGRKMKSTFAIVGNKLVQVEKHVDPGDKDSRFECYLDGDKLVVDMECDGVKAKRTFARA